ncbi:hypothetical protein [Microbacterium sp. NPDC089696]|uniref:hypothetical protein n=1 Tax=Microbacterium sp. NPDC089696 TaxID=3364199 RepID=UPI003805EAF3
MPERIDHVAEARRLQETARGIVTDNPTAFAPYMAAVILLDEARLEAQLALVEQQRIANVLALLRIESENRITPTDALDSIYEIEAPEWGEKKLSTRDEIKEALGLT